MSRTAETITDEEIRDLRSYVINDPTSSTRMTDEIYNLARIALGTCVVPEPVARYARGYIADLLNSRDLCTQELAAEILKD